MCVSKTVWIAHFLFVFCEACQEWCVDIDETNKWVFVWSGTFIGMGFIVCCRQDLQQGLHVSPLLRSPLQALCKSAEACSSVLKLGKQANGPILRKDKKNIDIFAELTLYRIYVTLIWLRITVQVSEWRDTDAKSITGSVWISWGFQFCFEKVANEKGCCGLLSDLKWKIKRCLRRAEDVRKYNRV